jgi:hypothetical protein
VNTYSSDQKQKFVAIIAEKDDEGNPYIPTFLRSRIYIDMSDPFLRIQNFDQLLRWTENLRTMPSVRKI